MRFAAALVLVALAAGCGSGGKSNEPTTALLTGVRADGDTVAFEFDSKPQKVEARYVPKSQVAECGSGASVALRGGAFAVVHFTPAQTASVGKDGTVTPTYTGPRRLTGSGPVLDVVKFCDFEADVGWAIGVSKRLPLDVSTDGGTVTISFR
ncbi:MAG TPA: hypothetical protein VFA56_00040 [Gaiellaceae bacterium]|nr:hypothetical protein [Gaiellaceae bacterium]